MNETRELLRIAFLSTQEEVDELNRGLGAPDPKNCLAALADLLEAFVPANYGVSIDDVISLGEIEAAAVARAFVMLRLTNQIEFNKRSSH